VFQQVCHHQGVVVTSEATQVMSVLLMYMDYDLSSVVSWRGMYVVVLSDTYNVENIAELGRPQMTIWRIAITCWLSKATNTHLQYLRLQTHTYNI
jgi:hypothetical protein